MNSVWQSGDCCWLCGPIDGNLASMIEAAQDGEMGSTLSVDQSIFYLHQILLGVAYLRSLHIFHLNITSLYSLPLFLPPSFSSSLLLYNYAALLSFLPFICPFCFLTILLSLFLHLSHAGENILVLAGGRRLKLANFEKALHFEDIQKFAMHHLTGVSPHFSAPEVCRTNQLVVT